MCWVLGEETTVDHRGGVVVPGARGREGGTIQPPLSEETTMKEYQLRIIRLYLKKYDDIKKVAESEGVIIVHGGGKEVTKVCEQLGKEPKFVTSPSGIKSRYTDKETAEIFTMVMAGRINKTIVQMLQKNGINAVGLSGIDGKIIQAERKKKLLIVNEKGRKQAIDGGYTGKITEINSNLIQTLLDQGITPVISPIAISEEADFLNVDGDRAAAYVAGKVGADKVLFITNVDGLLMDDKLVTKLTFWIVGEG